MKVVFMGTPDFSVPVLEMLIKRTNVILVVTQPDKAVGRRKQLAISPVKKVALEHNIEVFQPQKIRQDFAKIKELKPDLIVTCAYGQILPQKLLDIPFLGAINVHASLLPKYRGSAPIQWALLNGEEKTGITLMYMDAGMDTGDMIEKSVYEIKPTDNCGEIHDQLAKMGAELLEKNLEGIKNKTVQREKQNDDEATYAPMIKREDELLDFNVTGELFLNKIRAFNPWPLAYINYQNTQIKILNATFESRKSNPGNFIITKDKFGVEVLDGIVYFTQIKPVGKKQMDVKSFLNGLKNKGDF